MHLFIIGSNGFIGGSCKLYFENKGYQVTCFDKTLAPCTTGSNYFSAATHTLESIFTNHSFDVCINAAGSGDVGLSVQDPQADFQANCVFTFEVLECIRKFQPTCKYFHISSAAVYGNPLEIPIREDSRLLPISPYGWHKLLAENICKEYFDLYAIPVVIVRPFSVYGPGLRKQLFWDWHLKSTKDAEIEIWGTGKESRDFIYIDDLCHCFDIIIANADFQLSIYNVASGSETTIQEVADIYFSECKKKYWFNNKKKEGTPINWRADTALIQQMGFKASVHVRSGIKSMIEWQRKNS